MKITMKITKSLCVAIIFCFFSAQALYSNPNIILFGLPGAGKGTLSQKLIEKYQYAHICPGNLLRAEVRNHSDFGKEIEPILAKGGYVPEKCLFSFLKTKIIEARNENLPIIFDGYPRSVEALELLNSFLKELSIEKNTIVLYLNIEEEKLKERVLNRVVCNNCNKVYTNKPAKVESNILKPTEMHDAKDGYVSRLLNATLENENLLPNVAHHQYMELEKLGFFDEPSEKPGLEDRMKDICSRSNEQTDCDTCQTKLETRPQDTPEILEKRINHYVTIEKPLFQSLAYQGYQVLGIDVDRDPNKIFKHACKLIDNHSTGDSSTGEHPKGYSLRLMCKSPTWDDIKRGEVAIFSEGDKIYYQFNNTDKFEISKAKFSNNLPECSNSFDRILRTLKGDIANIDRYNIALQQEEERELGLAIYNYELAFEDITEDDKARLLNFTQLHGHPHPEPIMLRKNGFTDPEKLDQFF